MAAVGEKQMAVDSHMHRGHDLWNVSLKFRCET
jgi:endonuclease III